MFNKILCPLDGSDQANQALMLAIDMAKQYNVAVVLFHALLRNVNSSALQHFAEVEGLTKHVKPEVQRLQAMESRLELGGGPSYDDTATASRLLVQVGQHILDTAKQDAEEQGVSEVSTVLVDGDPADQIIRCAEEQNVDCVVMGSRGLSGIESVFLGSVSHKVMNRVPCTCIAVK